MIRPEMAQRFIDQITEYTEYNINIMDESGVIIASRDKDRIGSYHEAADRIIRGKEDTAVIEDARAYPGVLPGINMAITVDGRREGVVGVTGEPAAIREVAMVTRLAIEAMLKYERQQEQILLRQGRKENFFHLLTRVEDADPSDLRAAAGILGYDESILRVPVLCRILDDTPPDTVLEGIWSGRDHWFQDLSSIIDERHILVFKTLREKRGGRAPRFREQVLDYLDEALRRFERTGVRTAFFIGTPQSSFSQYLYAYRHARWLETVCGDVPSGKMPPEGISRVSMSSAKADPEKAAARKAFPEKDDRREYGRVHFFYDHTAEYFYSVLPREELHRVFYQYSLQLQGEERGQFRELVGALIETNFNLTDAAKRLYVHKNTMMYRYNKIKDMLGIDPVRSASDRTFLILLYHSL